MSLFNMVGGGEKNTYGACEGTFYASNQSSVTLYANKSNVEIIGVIISATPARSTSNPIWYYTYHVDNVAHFVNYDSYTNAYQATIPTISGGKITVTAKNVMNSVGYNFNGSYHYYIFYKNN